MHLAEIISQSHGKDKHKFQKLLQATSLVFIRRSKRPAQNWVKSFPLFSWNLAHSLTLLPASSFRALFIHYPCSQWNWFQFYPFTQGQRGNKLENWHCEVVAQKWAFLNYPATFRRMEPDAVRYNIWFVCRKSQQLIKSPNSCSSTQNWRFMKKKDFHN